MDAPRLNLHIEIRIPGKVPPFNMWSRFLFTATIAASIALYYLGYEEIFWRVGDGALPILAHRITNEDVAHIVVLLYTTFP